MNLTKELIDEIVLAAQDVEYGKITIAITGQQNAKIVDIITEKRERYKESVQTVNQPGGYQKENKNIYKGIAENE